MIKLTLLMLGLLVLGAATLNALRKCTSGWCALAWIAALLIVAPMLANARELRVALVIDNDVATDPTPYVIRAGQLISGQLGLPVLISQTAYNHVADDSQPLFLSPKVPFAHGSDVTVFLTGRDLHTGEQRLRGFAIPFSAWTDNAIAVVRIENDGFDHEIIAHEIAHTLGAPHDDSDACKSKSPAAGYLMQTYGVSGSDTYSDCTRQQVALYVSAATSEPAAVTPAPAMSNATGGGAFDSWIIGALLVLVIVQTWRAGTWKAKAAYYMERSIGYQNEAKKHEIVARHTQQDLRLARAQLGEYVRGALCDQFKLDQFGK